LFENILFTTENVLSLWNVHVSGYLSVLAKKVNSFVRNTLFPENIQNSDERERLKYG
jgi:hypothetical protein